MVRVEPFLKADNYKEIQHLLWKPNFYYRIHKSSLCHPILFHTFIPCFFKIGLNINFQNTPKVLSIEIILNEGYFS